MIRGVFAHCTVTDLERAEDWYRRVLDGEPDVRPMPGLLEWQLGEGFGVQVWSEAERAGHSCAVLTVDDMDATAGRLTAAGIENDGPQPGGGARILQLVDPDGNRVVLLGS